MLVVRGSVEDDAGGLSGWLPLAFFNHSMDSAGEVLGWGLDTGERSGRHISNSEEAI